MTQGKDGGRLAAPNDEMSAAMALHQAGRVAEAAHAYERLLAHDPRYADALHLAGVAACQMGDGPTGIERMRRAIALRPAVPGYHFNPRNALKDLGRFEDAAAAQPGAAGRAP